MKTFTLSTIILLALTGCGTVSYSPFVGEQPEWPTAKGAFVKMKGSVPIYRGLPEKPYTVLGHLIITTDPGAVEQQAAWAAQHYKADAIVFVDSSTMNVGSVGGGNAFAYPTKGGAGAFGSSFSSAIQQTSLTCLLVKWK